MAQHAKGLYTVEEACEYLGGIVKSTLYKYMGEQSLESIKMRGRRMFTREQLDNFIRSQELLAS